MDGLIVRVVNMDLGGEFCLVCGGQPPLYSNRMCEKCTRDRTELAEVPKNVPWTRCARCSRIDFQGRWSEVEDDELWHELVQRNVKFHPEVEDLELGLHAQEVDGRHTLIHLQLEGVIDNLLYTDEKTMRARMSNGVCLTCTRRALEIISKRPCRFVAVLVGLPMRNILRLELLWITYWKKCQMTPCSSSPKRGL